MNNKIRIKLGAFEFEAEGDSDTVLRERLAMMESLPTLLSYASSSVQTKESLENDKNIDNKDSFVEKPKMLYTKSQFHTINEFLIQKNFSTVQDISLGMIFYFNVYKEIYIVTSQSLIDLYKEAKIKQPTNPTDILNKLTQKGYLYSNREKINNKLCYEITDSGKKYIENYEPKETSTKKRKSTRQSKKANSKYNSITREDLNLDKYPLLKEYSNFKDKMLLALYIFSNEEKGEYFSVQDIKYILTEIFKEYVTTDQITGVLSRNATWFNKIKNEETKNQEYKLLNNANTYISTILQK